MSRLISVLADAAGSHDAVVDEALKAGREPVFVYFFARWCPDCTRSTPLVRATFARLPSATLIEVDVNEKSIYRDKSSGTRKALDRHKLKCLPTLLCVSPCTQLRLDTELESCSDPIKGQFLVDEYIDKCVPPRLPVKHIKAAVLCTLAAGLAIAVFRASCRK